MKNVHKKLLFHSEKCEALINLRKKQKIFDKIFIKGKKTDDNNHKMQYTTT